MTQTYLVATDMSARSDRAVRRAVRLTGQHGARLIVCHVVDDAAPAELATEFRAASRARLEQFVASLSPTNDTELRVDFGDPTADLLATLRGERPDLLILGSHRPRPFLDALRETTAQRIARLADCPVLMVADRDDHDYTAIAAATDFSPASAEAIKLAHRLAPDAPITPIHAYHVPYSGIIARGGVQSAEVEASFRREAEQHDALWRKETTLPAACGKTSMIPGSPLQALGQFIAGSGATLVCAGAHGRAGQGRALLGSVATDLMRYPPCDVLIARPSGAG